MILHTVDEEMQKDTHYKDIYKICKANGGADHEICVPPRRAEALSIADSTSRSHSSTPRAPAGLVFKRNAVFITVNRTGEDQNALDQPPGERYPGQQAKA